MRLRIVLVLSLLLGLLCPLAAQHTVFTPQAPTPPIITPPATTPSLRVRLTMLERRLEQKEIPADGRNLALLKFKIEQAQLFLKKLENESGYTYQYGNGESTRSLLEATIARGETVAEAVGDAADVPFSQTHERAYIAANDGSVQPYWIFLPRDYTPEKQWPLVVFLHGYSPDITKINPWLPGTETWQLATDRGFIMAVPYGRRNSDFVNIGEDDTLAVTEAASRHYAVDRDRTFLLGPSMGGFGVHAVGLHHPDRFAALSAMCARTDFYLWFNLQRDTQPAWKQINYDADDPRHLKRNAQYLPIFMQHGALDSIVPVEHSRRFYADLKALGAPVFYREIADASHYIYFEYGTYQVALDWMKKLRRPPVPRRVRYSTGTLRNNHAYWATIDGFADYSRLAHIDAEIKTGNVLEVKTENVARFTLQVPVQFVEANKPLTLVVNGHIQDDKFDAAQPVQWPRGAAGLKTPHLAGPIKEAYRDPFLLVYGTLGSAADKANAERFLQEWNDYADGVPPLKADTAVTEADKANYNLILFGTRQSNALLKEQGGALPVELTPGGYRLGQREVYAGGKTLGVQLCYPSPFNKERLVVVQSGVYWGSKLPINHKFDLLPEYIVYEQDIEMTDLTNRALAAGFFDDDWKLPETASQKSE